MYLIFPNFHIPPELIHHLLITSFSFCHLILQPLPSKLLLFCLCFHPRNLVCIMLGQRVDMLQHFASSVLRSGHGRHLRVLDSQPILFCELDGCRLELHKVLTLGCC